MQEKKNTKKRGQFLREILFTFQLELCLIKHGTLIIIKTKLSRNQICQDLVVLISRQDEDGYYPSIPFTEP